MNCKQIKLMVALVAFAGFIAFGISAAFGQEPHKGWLSTGSAPNDYDMGIDHTVSHTGKASGYIKSKVSEPTSSGFGTYMQMFNADDYRGKRVRMSGYVKAEKIEGWAGLWMRIDGPSFKMLGFDNMQDRPIKGTTDWEKYEIVLDVPQNSVNIAFGILLSGKGQAWIDDLQFEIVDKDVPTTDLGGKEKKDSQKQPVKLDFED